MVDKVKKLGVEHPGLIRAGGNLKDAGFEFAVMDVVNGKMKVVAAFVDGLDAAAYADKVDPGAKKWAAYRADHAALVERMVR